MSFAHNPIKNDFQSIFPDFNEQKSSYAVNPNLEVINGIHESYEFPIRNTEVTTSRTIKQIKPTTTTQRLQYERFHNYGNSFGRNWLLKNTYIAKNNFYEKEPPIGPGPLTKALFFKETFWNYTENLDDSDKGIWDKSDDKEWRATTRAPYFENIAPGEGKILPASAVVGEYYQNLRNPKI